MTGSKRNFFKAFTQPGLLAHTPGARSPLAFQQDETFKSTTTYLQPPTLPAKEGSTASANKDIQTPVLTLHLNWPGTISSRSPGSTTLPGVAAVLPHFRVRRRSEATSGCGAFVALRAPDPSFLPPTRDPLPLKRPALLLGLRRIWPARTALTTPARARVATTGAKWAHFSCESRRREGGAARAQPIRSTEGGLPRLWPNIAKPVPSGRPAPFSLRSVSTETLRQVAVGPAHPLTDISPDPMEGWSLFLSAVEEARTLS